jgi:flagellar motor switch/type III secretory pathway protein FliN
MLASLAAKLPAVETVSTAGLAHVAGIEIGMTSLPLDDALTLRVHDVVLMDVTAFLPNHIGVIRTSPDTAWRVSVNGETVVLQEARPATPIPSISRDSPVVVLLFEAGQVRIPLDKFGELAAGAKLDRHNATEILIRMDRKPFASGELIQVADRLGVRLLTVGDVRSEP